MIEIINDKPGAVFPIARIKRFLEKYNPDLLANT